MADLQVTFMHQDLSSALVPSPKTSKVHIEKNLMYLILIFSQNPNNLSLTYF